MHTTRLSLIQQLSGGNDSEAWAELDRLYRPLIQGWLQRFRLQSNDVEDVIQDVMAILVREVANFQHNGRVGAFRNWLRSTTVNLARNALRRQNANAFGAGVPSVQGFLEELEDPSSSLSKQFDQEHDQVIARRLLERAASQFEPITLKIFQMHVIESQGARETAEQLGVSVASVHTAKSRVLRKLRQDAAEWIQEWDPT